MEAPALVAGVIHSTPSKYKQTLFIFFLDEKNRVYLPTLPNVFDARVCMKYESKQIVNVVNSFWNSEFNDELIFDSCEFQKWQENKDWFSLFDQIGGPLITWDETTNQFMANNIFI